jgi:hypothetical protein
VKIKLTIDFGALIIDLQSLAKNSKEDFKNQFWNEYETYLKKYNEILKDLQILGFYKRLEFIKSVPFSDQEFETGFSKQEKAKLREIANSAEILLKKVKLLLSPPKTKNGNKTQIRSNQIFLISTKENKIEQKIIQTLVTLDLDPILLDRKKFNIMEKIDNFPQVSFAIFLILADGKSYVEQNITFELGYLMGKLGPENVVAIYETKKKFQNLKNNLMIQWIEYKTGWDLKLVRELQSNNFKIDTTKLSWI